MNSTIEGRTNYAVNGRIMLSSSIVLFFVVFFLICFHSYARWFLCGRRRRLGHHAGETHPIFPLTTAASDDVSPHEGLDLSILKTLPTFIYSTTTAHDPLLECAVCLSGFENEERGRVLPECKHTFHVECIDAWFRSHSNCPLCRAPVQSHTPVSLTETVITVNEPPVPQRQLRDGSEAEVGSSESSAWAILSPEWCRRKSEELYLSLSVGPSQWVGEISLGSHESQNGHVIRLPANGMLSLMRIWSI